ncbi:MAG: glycosyltransferase, partial [Acidimicrobiales bacterium]
MGPDAAGDAPRYGEWVGRHEEERVARARRAPATGPEVALLLVVGDPEEGALRRCLAAVAAQTSARWTLSATCAGSPDSGVRGVLDAVLAPLPKERAGLRWCPEGTPEAGAAATALAASTAPAFLLLDQDDLLAPDAVALLAQALEEADVAYADEDRVVGTALADPRLKPDWSPELCLSTPYVGRPVAYRREPVALAGGVRAVDGGDWEHDLLLRVTERTGRVAHVAE